MNQSQNLCNEGSWHSGGWRTVRTLLPSCAVSSFHQCYSWGCGEEFRLPYPDAGLAALMQTLHWQIKLRIAALQFLICFNSRLTMRGKMWLFLAESTIGAVERQRGCNCLESRASQEKGSVTCEKLLTFQEVSSILYQAKMRPLKFFNGKKRAVKLGLVQPWWVPSATHY